MRQFPGKSAKPTFTVVLPVGLRRALKETSEVMGCAQGETVRTALYFYLSNLGVLGSEMREAQGNCLEKMDKVG
jgi:hypothetical protein